MIERINCAAQPDALPSLKINPSWPAAVIADLSISRIPEWYTYARWSARAEESSPRFPGT